MTRMYRLVLTAVLAAPHVMANDALDQRFRIPNTFAQKIAGELFPNRCGHEGKGCGIHFPPAHCPKLFAIAFPDANPANASSPETVWVTIDGMGKVEAVTDKRPSCKGGISS